MSKNPTAIPMQMAPVGTLQIRTTKMRILLSPYGARIREFWLTNADGTETNIAVGLPDDDAYATHDSYIGAVCGRYANRIANSAYRDPDGNKVMLAANEGSTHLHGGITGFDRHDWSVTQNTDHAIAFHLESPDGDQGYPGNFTATATYSIVAENRLRLDITATCDQTCPVNMTSHAYWNLTGRFDHSAARHILKIDADAYLPVDDHLIPLAGRKDVARTAYDFRTPSPIAQKLAEADQGFDHNFCLNGRRGVLKQIATLSDPDSRRTMKLFSTEAGLQFYLAQHFTDAMQTPDGKGLHKSGGIALEPQTFPNSPNRPDFPSPWLNPGETYKHVIEWEF